MSSSEEEFHDVPWSDEDAVLTFDYNDPLLLSPVIAAAALDDVEGMKQLLLQPLRSVNINDNLGNTPLHVAVLKQKVAAFDYLLTREDVRIDAQNFMGASPLYLACCLDNPYFAFKLLEADANVNCVIDSGETLLCCAFKHPHNCELAKKLILKGVDVNAKNGIGDTPLHVACTTCINCVYMLLYFNSDATVADGNGVSVLNLALMHLDDHGLHEILFNCIFDEFNESCDLETLTQCLRHNLNLYARMVKHVSSVEYNANSLLNFCLEVSFNIHSIEVCVDKFPYIFQAIFFAHSSVFLVSFMEHLPETLEKRLGSRELFYKLASNVCDIWQYVPFNSLLPVSCLVELCVYEVSNLILYMASIGYPIVASDLVAIHKHKEYGSSELFTLSLYIVDEYIWERSLPKISYALLMSDINLDIEKCLSVPDRLTLDTLKMVMKFFSGRKVQKALSYNELEIACPDVPSLLELSRNASRRCIIEKFKIKTPCQFYTHVDYLQLSRIYKEIICYLKPIY